MVSRPSGSSELNRHDELLSRINGPQTLVSPNLLLMRRYDEPWGSSSSPVGNHCHHSRCRGSCEGLVFVATFPDQFADGCVLALALLDL